MLAESVLIFLEDATAGGNSLSRRAGTIRLGDGVHCASVGAYSEIVSPYVERGGARERKEAVATGIDVVEALHSIRRTVSAVDVNVIVHRHCATIAEVDQCQDRGWPPSQLGACRKLHFLPETSTSESGDRRCPRIRVTKSQWQQNHA